MAPTMPTERADARRLPDERFWKRYSPHHELPISSATSVALHALLLVVLVVGAALGARWGLASDRPPEVVGLVIAPGGRPDGDNRPAASGNLPQGQEAGSTEGEKTRLDAPQRPPEIQPPKPDVPPLLPKDAKENSRAIEDQGQETIQGLEQAGQKAREQLEKALPGRGPRGPGKPGAPGGNVLSEPKPHNQRWTMIFNTRDGHDYLRQLHDLGAILAIPGNDGQFRVIRELMKRPLEMHAEDLAKLDRIYWADDKPQSVRSLATALGLAPAPEFFAAFFPGKLEKELLDKELEYLGNRGTEADIDLTVFRVVRRGDRYEPVVVEQKLKRR
jgi:hypothetical protein